MADGLGVAVVGVGMAGRAHAAGYRTATALFDAGLPPVRLTAIADVNPAFAEDAARRFGYERAETSWRAIAEADDVDVVSVVVANSLHREIAEGLLDAGKHVLCEKPLAGSVADAEAMVEAATAADTQTATGFTFRWSPAIGAVRSLLGDADTGIGDPLHLDLHYWCDYGVDPRAPMSWRYRGGPGTGALADIGSHLIDTAEFLGGRITSVSGAVLSTVIRERHLPAGVAMGHAAAELSDEVEPVENDDLVSFTARLTSGATATITASRVSYGHPNALGFTVFGTSGAAAFELDRAGEFLVADAATAGRTTPGYRRVLVGPAHPHMVRGLPMDFPGVGYGQNDLFAFQARAWLEQVAGYAGPSRLPSLPSFADGLHNLRLEEAVVRSAAAGGAEVPVSDERKAA